MKKIMIALALTIASSSAFAATVICAVEGNKTQTFKNCRQAKNSPTVSCVVGNGVENDFTRIERDTKTNLFTITREITVSAGLGREQSFRLPTLESKACTLIK